MTESGKRKLIIILHGNVDETALELSQLPVDAIRELTKAIAKLIADHKLLLRSQSNKP